eukprot:scaffold12124_cov18-Tisochrysis_lutea.AAC.1
MAQCPHLQGPSKIPQAVPPRLNPKNPGACQRKHQGSCGPAILPTRRQMYMHGSWAGAGPARLADPQGGDLAGAVGGHGTAAGCSHPRRGSSAVQARARAAGLHNRGPAEQ